MPRQAIGLIAGYLFLAIATPAAHAEPGRLTVIELFTAQGCAACPPADAYLGELAARDDVLALGFHVDYWDFIGWRDPYADADFTRRQQRYADRLSIPYVFTPQMVVDGVLHGSGSNRGTMAQHISVAASKEKPWVDVQLTHHGEGVVRIHMPEMNYPGEAEIFLVRYETQLKTKITRGENAGRELTNYNVVRQFQPIAMWHGEALDLTVPLRHEDTGAPEGYAVIVQEPETGRIVGATRVPK